MGTERRAAPLFLRKGSSAPFRPHLISVPCNFPEHRRREAAARQEEVQPQGIAVSFPVEIPYRKAKRSSELPNSFIGNAVHEVRKAADDRIFAFSNITLALQGTGTPQCTTGVNVEFIDAVPEFVIDNGDMKNAGTTVEIGAVTCLQGVPGIVPYPVFEDMIKKE